MGESESNSNGGTQSEAWGLRIGTFLPGTTGESTPDGSTTVLQMALVVPARATREHLRCFVHFTLPDSGPSSDGTNKVTVRVCQSSSAHETAKLRVPGHSALS
ncbi:hypothetical protein L227DRAFT_609795 [Lentinus tigrinus ALCF2SS1-6]|uniref:Uncharacterized protein n=1 Tax=Lentinus tigrinus ALCF2SS1-6 TaxID=1328759 RepID=A0A5C2SKD9_9APHY|nr:hypothetical protein L227DRAFT_609795 [Lentinus tigrinus ALCF2SS1-6]